MLPLTWLVVGDNSQTHLDSAQNADSATVTEGGACHANRGKSRQIANKRGKEKEKLAVRFDHN